MLISQKGRKSIEKIYKKSFKDIYNALYEALRKR